MKRSFRKNMLRTVRGTLSRFLAIFAIVALGVGFLAGLLASPDDMRLSVDRYFDQQEIYDIKMVSTLGLDPADVQQVAAVPGVRGVQAAKDLDVVLKTKEGDLYTTRLQTLPGEGDADLNRCVLVEGRMPEQPGECVVVETPSFVNDTQWIGQQLTPEPAQETLPPVLTVVGVVKNPLYFSMESEHTQAGTGSVELAAFTPEATVTADYDTALYLTVNGALRLNAFEQPYRDLIRDMKPTLEELGARLVQGRIDALRADGESRLAEAEAEYEEKKAEAEEQFAQAEQELEDARNKLAQGEQELEDARAEMARGEEEYQQQTAQAREKLSGGESELSAARQQLSQGEQELIQARAEAQAQLEDARAQLAEGRAQLDSAREELEAGKAQLADAWEEFSAGEARVRDGEAQLAQAAQQLSDAKHELWYLNEELVETLLADQLAAYRAAEAQLAAGREELERSRSLLQEKQAEADAAEAVLAEKNAQWEAGRAELEQQEAEAQAQLAAAEQELADARAQIAQGEQELADGQRQLADGQKEYEEKMKDAQSQVAQGEEELSSGREALTAAEEEYRRKREEAEDQLADGARQLKEARRELDRIIEGQCLVLDRRDSVGFSGYESNADKIAAIAKVFPAFFFLVAALVALTTMTRLVEEERSQVGALKSLGYSSGAIAAKYLLYAAAASLTGSAVGLAVGMKLFPTIITKAYGILYDLPEVLTPFQPVYAAASCAAATACVLLATLSACWAELRESPAQLLLPRAPKAGKRVFLERITPLWRRMKFTHKVAARNLIRYKKRFFMTVVGISGCTALLLTGFGLRDAIFNLVDLQFRQLSHSDLTVTLSDDDVLVRRQFLALLNDESRVAAWCASMVDLGGVVTDGSTPADEVRITVPEEWQGYDRFFTFRHRLDDEPVVFDEDAVIVTEKLAERQHWHVGDTVALTNQDNLQGTVTITDICENYVYHSLYLSKSTYRQVFGKDSIPNTLLLQLPQGADADGIADLSRDLLAFDGVAAAVSMQEMSDNFDNSIRSLNAIVLVLIFSAGALAFVVLYNLTNINISERVKEIATIKVLGFYDKEVSAYIYRENAVLTLIGAGAGLLLGVALHQFVVRTAEIPIVMFSRTAQPLSYVLSFALTVGFSVLVNLVMHRRLKKISMVESMKAPE